MREIIIYKNSIQAKVNKYIHISGFGDFTFEVISDEKSCVIDLSNYLSFEDSKGPNMKMVWRMLIEKIVGSGTVSCESQANRLVPYEKFVNSVVGQLHIAIYGCMYDSRGIRCYEHR